MTAVAPVAELDAETIAELTPPCQLRRLVDPDAPCGTPATWLLRVTMDCGHQGFMLLCDERLAELVPKMRERRAWFGCKCRDFDRPQAADWERL